MWRYQKRWPPYSKASPKSATTYEKYFQHPDKTNIEAEIETELANRIEGPVHQFLNDLCDANFIMSERQREAATRYISLLFSRSRARRKGSKHVQDLIGIALQKFLDNDGQVVTVAAQWSLEQTFKGNPMWVPPRYVRRVAQKLLTMSRSPSAEQANFVAAIRDRMNVLDERMFHGQWKLVTAPADNPFFISDAPVVTWERLDNGALSYGIGFARPNVEVIPPISPAACLHILPAVRRTRQVVQPTVEDIQKAEAAYAFSACYADRHSTAIDKLIQTDISSAKIGENVFTLWHRNLDSLFFEMLLGQSPFK